MLFYIKFNNFIFFNDDKFYTADELICVFFTFNSTRFFNLDKYFVAFILIVLLLISKIYIFNNFAT